MSQASRALKQTLENHRISQNKLAVAMDINRSTVFHWVNKLTDPSADAVLKILNGLKTIDPEAAREFVKLYLSDSLEKEAATEPKSKLEQLRTKAGVTQREIAEALGVHVEIVRNWEAGLAEPQLTVAQIRVLLSIFKCSWEDLPDSLGIG